MKPGWRQQANRVGLIALMILTCACRSQSHGGRVTQSKAASALNCPLVSITSEDAFHFQAFNEWHTVHALVVGCAADSKLLRSIANGPAVVLLQELAEKQPVDLPDCQREANDRSSFVRELNRRHRVEIVRDACAAVRADI